MASELDEVKKLPPEERIKRLKELTEKHKKEIEDAQKLAKQSEEESNEIKKELDQIPIPQLKAVDIDDLFSPEAQQMFATKRFTETKSRRQKEEEETEKTEKALEERIQEEKITKQELREQRQYIEHLTLDQTKDKAMELYQLAQEKGYLDVHEQVELYELNRKTDVERQRITQGVYKGAHIHDAMEALDTAESLLRKTGYNI